MSDWLSDSDCEWLCHTVCLWPTQSLTEPWLGHEIRLLTQFTKLVTLD